MGCGASTGSQAEAMKLHSKIRWFDGKESKDQKEVKVKLTTSGNTEHSGPLRLVGRCPKTGISRVARIQVNGRKQLPWLTVIASD